MTRTSEDRRRLRNSHNNRIYRGRDHFVYTAYDADGQALYVGCTHDPQTRYYGHRKDSGWTPRVARWFKRGPYTRETARRLERHVIWAERPLYNRIRYTGDPKTWAS